MLASIRIPEMSSNLQLLILETFVLHAHGEIVHIIETNSRVVGAHKKSFAIRGKLQSRHFTTFAVSTMSVATVDLGVVFQSLRQ